MERRGGDALAASEEAGAPCGGTAAPVALYLHVPFCRTKCSYCDFTSTTDAGAPLPAEGVMWAVRRDLGPDATLADAYCAAVPLYLEEFVERGVLSDVPSVYVGGGTPTVLGSRLPALVRTVLGMVGLREGAEITVEANPESVTPELLGQLREAGVTRVSLGVQSLDDRVLRTLGRCHTADEARTAIAALRVSGLEFSVDLMCGIAGLGDDVWEASVREAAECGVGHVSVYPLSIEDGTPLAACLDAGEMPEPDPDMAAGQMAAAAEVLREAGFERYEVSSYAKPGHRARHNVGYWTGVPYLGVGPAAASMLPVAVSHCTPMDHYTRTWPEEWRARFVVNDTLASFLGYLWDRQPATLEALTESDIAREDAMLGLRMSDGIGDALAERAGAVAGLRELEAAGLVEHVGGHWRTTERGWLLGNEVFERVWAGE